MCATCNDEGVILVRSSEYRTREEQHYPVEREAPCPDCRGEALTYEEWLARNRPKAPVQPERKPGETDEDYELRLEEWAYAHGRPAEENDYHFEYEKSMPMTGRSK